MAAPVGTPKTSAYARSRLFRWGVWILIVAAVLIAWNAIKTASVAKVENLQTLEGTVVDYRTGTTSQPYGVRSGKRYRGSARPLNVLRIETSDGRITEFSSSDWIRPPKFGWRRGVPISVKYSVGRDLYEVVVAGEVLQDVATTQQKRRAAGQTTRTFAALLLVIGVLAVAIGFLMSLQGETKPPLPPATPPPLPGNLSSA